MTSTCPRRPSRAHVAAVARRAARERRCCCGLRRGRRAHVPRGAARRARAAAPRGGPPRGERSKATTCTRPLPLLRGGGESTLRPTPARARGAEEAHQPPLAGVITAGQRTAAASVTSSGTSTTAAVGATKPVSQRTRPSVRAATRSASATATQPAGSLLAAPTATARRPPAPSRECR